jgi:pimeloyl-ACP methyl ester carboxylesterase
MDGALRAVLGTISGPVVLVGHSYGGAAMSNAATGNEQVHAPVFIAGWMPDEGESVQQLLESEVFGDSLVSAALRPVPLRTRMGARWWICTWIASCSPRRSPATSTPSSTKRSLTGSTRLSPQAL